MKKNNSFDSTGKIPLLLPYQKSSFNSPYTINGINLLKIPKRISFSSLSKSKTNFSSNIPLPNTHITQYNKYTTSKTIPNSKKLFVKISDRLLTQKINLSASSKLIIKKAIQPKSSIELIPKEFDGVVSIFQHTETPMEFIMKTNELVKLKYITRIKAERLERLKETYNNEVDSINDRIKAIEEARDLFAETFCSKFNNYIKHLVMQKNAEKIQLKKIKSQKMEAENEILHIKNKIRQKQAELLRKQKWYFLQKKIKMNLLSQVKRSTHFKSVELYFKSPEELISELKKIEMNHVCLIDKYNEINAEIRELHIHKEAQLIEINNSVIHILKLVEQKEFELNELINCNKELKDEKEQIKKDKSSVSTNKNSSQKLYRAILEIDKRITKLAPNNIINLQFHTPLDKTDMVSLLFYIERTVDFFLQKNSYYLNNTQVYSEKNYQHAQKKAWKDRQALLNMKIKEENHSKMSQLIEKVSTKNNKVYIIPFRKVDKYYYENSIKNEKKFKKTMNKTYDEKTIDNYLHD